ncbi:MAG: hypothetical protein ACK5IB_08355 [Qingshengfaniella sp.]
MIGKTILAVTFVAASAGAAIAQPATGPGYDMMAQIAGVETGVYTAAELSRLNSGSDLDSLERRTIMNKAKSGLTFISASPSAGAHQLAAEIGVNAADFTMPQLIQLQSAKAEGDSLAIRTILADAGVDINSTTLQR